MSDPLDWRIGATGERPAGLVEATDAGAGRPRRRGVVTALVAALYFAALVAAAFFGFGLGRWSTVQSAVWGEIADRLAVEELAWRNGDARLYAGTLDGQMDPWVRFDLEEGFRQTAPAAIALEIADLRVIAPDRVAVDVTATRESRPPRIEAREYARRGTAWLRTMPTGGADRSSEP